MSKEPSVNLSLQIVPLGTENPMPLIDKAIEVIQQSKVKHEVNAFSTVLEGPLNELLDLALKSKDASFDAGAEELIMNIQIHLKKGEDVKIEDKVTKFR